MSRRTSEYYNTRRDNGTFECNSTWHMDLGIVCLYRGICGDTVLRIPTMDLTYISERHISAGIVLPSTSASFCLNLRRLLKNKIFRSQAIITWVCKLWLIKVITVIPS